MNLPKVLVASPINSVKEYVLQEYFDSIRNFTYTNYGCYFVDNSDDASWHLRNVVLKGFDCDYVSPKGKTNQEYVTLSQQKIVSKFLSSDYEFLLMIECDIITPKTIIEQLLSYETQVVACNYFIGSYGNVHLMKMGIEDKPFGIKTNRNLGDIEGFHEYIGTKKRSKIHGLGCVMLHRSVFEKVNFHINEDSKETHSDVPFYFDLNQQGIETQVHPIIVRHKNSSWLKINTAWL